MVVGHIAGSKPRYTQRPINPGNVNRGLSSVDNHWLPCCYNPTFSYYNR
jgi:hypothetical protein